MPAVREVIQRAVQQLQNKVDDAHVDVQALATHALEKDRGWLIAHADDKFPESVLGHFKTMLESRQKGIPIAHITGSRDFWSLSLKVTSDTLIPRPDTELLVEQVLDLELPDDASVLDFGTGTGAIALALASENSNWRLQALEASAAALTVARENAQTHQIANVEFIHGDVLDMFQGQKFHAIASNPPYIAAGDKHLTQGDVRFEPSTALVSGQDGLDCIRYLISTAQNYLLSNGCVLLEHGYNQGRLVRELFAEHGYIDITSVFDLSGIERVTHGRLAY